MESFDSAHLAAVADCSGTILASAVADGRHWLSRQPAGRGHWNGRPTAGLGSAATAVPAWSTTHDGPSGGPGRKGGREGGREGWRQESELYDVMWHEQVRAKDTLLNHSTSAP